MNYLKLIFTLSCLILATSNFAKAEDRLDPLHKPITVREIQDAAKKPWDIEYDRVIITRASVARLEPETYNIFQSKPVPPQFKAEACLIRGLATEVYFISLMNPMLNHNNTTHIDYELVNKLMAAARIDFDTAFRLKPDTGIVCSTYGIFQFYADGDRKKALVQLRKGVKLTPNSAYSHNILGFGLYMLGSDPSNKDAIAETKEAEEEYRKAITLSPNFAGPHLNLSEIYLVKKRYLEAQNELDIYLSHGTKKDAQASIVLLFQKQITEGLNKRN